MWDCVLQSSTWFWFTLFGTCIDCTGLDSISMLGLIWGILEYLCLLGQCRHCHHGWFIMQWYAGLFYFISSTDEWLGGSPAMPCYCTGSANTVWLSLMTWPMLNISNLQRRFCYIPGMTQHHPSSTGGIVTWLLWLNRALVE